MTPAVRLSADLQIPVTRESASADRCRQSAIALQKQGRLEDAIHLYLRGLALDPSDAAGYRCLGTAYKKQGRLDMASVCFRRSVELCPAFPEAWNNLGNTLSEQGDLAAAAECFLRACRVQPEFAGAHFNYAQALAGMGRFDASIAACRRALELAPRSAEFYNGLGIVLFDAQRVDEALAAYEQALNLRPDFPSARYNRALAWLLKGDFARGWSEYEWRWKLPGAPPIPFQQPRWDGAVAPEATVLLDAEQGLGDTIQFARYAPLVKSRVGRVILRCQKPLVTVLRSLSGVDEIIGQEDQVPHFDAWVPLLSVPQFFTPAIENIPRAVPYLSADDSLVRFWQPRIGRFGGLRVGVHWQGNPAFLKDRFRSIPLACFEPLAKLPGVRLISLQKEAGTEQLTHRIVTFPVVDLGLKPAEIHGPFLDTAAILRCLDVVVTSDTSLAHLAGALGIETWLAVPHVPEWRWLLGRENTPWYPTLRLARQSQVGQWGGVFVRIAAALRNRAVAAQRRGLVDPQSPPDLPSR
ncbi:MAG TPA: tetratricopeptide repeat-containing glycosyltransferase family protein [Planctomycetaceae bacterium]|nr:tetratricopeptide repeat-containing glycosyltransferase family protein [Planctomycetaceae bacterium]